MSTIRELLRDADPLLQEPICPTGKRDLSRQAILAAASGTSVPARMGARSRIAVLVTVTFMVIAALFLSSRMRSFFVVDLQAAVRFEVRLAEDRPAPGLREAKVSGSDRSVYLHDEVIVSNGDIAQARVVQGSRSSQYSVEVQFNPSGAERMRAATGNHLGKPVAILLDGQVVLAPVLRSQIGASAMITGDHTREEAQRIVNGIQ